jgi:CDP-diacylglycerol--serine O-phosphatidyltransferase
MKHLPNILTLCNLICGCIAIAFALESVPFRTLSSIPGEYVWVFGTEQAYWAAIFIGLAGFFDLLDGAAARALKIFSPIGKDLDSLADIVSFGVAPAMILYKMLWACAMSEANALDASMWYTVPAFLLACFAALRLARFNITASTQKWSFTGMPVPAVGIIVASFPLIDFYTPEWSAYLQNKWAIYIIIAVLCWLMVSKFQFFKLMPAKWQIKYMWPQIVLLLVALAAVPLLLAAAIPVLFVLYIVLSFVYKAPQEAATQE